LTRSSAKGARIALALCAVGYLYAQPYFPVINNPNENVRFYMTAAIVEEGTYEIGAIRARWGWVNDAAVHHGKVFSVKAPGTSLLGVPGYAGYLLFTSLFEMERDRTEALFVCRVTGTVLPMLCFLFFFFRWLHRRTRHGAIADAAFLTVAFGSLLYGYSLLFVSHSLSAAVAFGAFMLLFDARHSTEASAEASAKASSPTRAFLAGLFTAGVTFFEYPGFVVSAVLAVYALFALRPRKRLVWFAVGALLPTLAVMHFQWIAFENPFTPGHLFVESDAFREAHHEGLYGATSFHWDAAGTLLFDLGSGLLPLSPFLAFAVIGFVRLFRQPGQRLDAAIALACFALTYVVICFMNNWRGGWTIGPRYLAVTVPFVAWVAAVGLSAIAERATRAATVLAVGTAGAGLVASGIPSVYYPHLPPEFGAPLAELFSVLIAHGYAPLNVASLADVFGTASMLPLFALCIGALVWAVARDAQGARARVTMTALSAVVATALAAPLFFIGSDEQPVRDAVAFVTRSWHPRGHDLASGIEETLAGSGDATPSDFDRLAEIYAAEGRDREARAAARRGVLLEERARIVRERRGH
jgi:hypothetical protein